MQLKNIRFFIGLILSICQMSPYAVGQNYIKNVEESDVYFNQQIARFPNGDILVGDSSLEPLVNASKKGKVVMARMDKCGQIVWAYSYSLQSRPGYLEFTDFKIDERDKILAYGSHYEGEDELLFLLSINGKSGKRAVYSLYDPKTTSGYFAYSLNAVENKFMINGFLTNPNVGLIAFFDEALNVLWAKKITPFESNGAAIINRDNHIIVRSGKYVFAMSQEGDPVWTTTLSIPAVNGPIEVSQGYILVVHHEDFSFFLKIDSEGQFLWQSDKFRAYEGSGAMSLLADGTILFTYNCEGATDNKLCQIILSSQGQIKEHRQLFIPQTINSGPLKQSIDDTNIITIAGNANPFVNEQTDIKDFLMQFSLNELTNDCMTWENFEGTTANTIKLDLEFAEIIPTDFNMEMVERSSADMDTFLYPLTAFCGASLEPELLSQDTILPCEEDWLVWLPNPNFSWVDGALENPRLIELPGIYKAKNKDCLDPIEIEFKLRKQDCGCPVFLPNAFSPNNDGINDELILYSECTLDAIQISIFNRFGGLVFSSNSTDQFWDGRFQKKDAQAGVYVALIQYRWTDSEGKQRNGQVYQDVALLR